MQSLFICFYLFYLQEKRKGQASKDTGIALTLFLLALIFELIP